MEAKTNRTKNTKFQRFMENDVTIKTVYAILILLCVIAAVSTKGKFLRMTNIFNIIRQSSIVGIVSIGMTMVLLIGGIDLSVTSTMAISGCLFALYSKGVLASGNPESVTILMLFTCLAIGAVIGLLNGIMIVYRGVEPFIITLGMMQAVRGLNYIITRGSPTGAVTPFWKAFGQSRIFGVIPPVIIVFIGFLLLFLFILNKTVFGRYVYAIGNNSEAARLSGIKVNRYKIACYVISGVLAALAGVLLTARIGIGEPNGSVGYDMDAIAACVIGGVAMSGGIGKMQGTLSGILIMSIIDNMMNLLGADPFLQIMIKGIIILVAVVMQRKTKK